MVVSGAFKTGQVRAEKAVPTIAFRVLDAPRLKDDYYCSVLAYCISNRTLAVALGHRVYLWTERYGVRYPPLPPVRQSNYVASLAFSSEEGKKAILATSRSSGHVTLWSLLEQKARFETSHPSAACAVAFRPTVAKRPSTSTGMVVNCEDLLVGDDAGLIYYYSVEWPTQGPGSMTLLSKIEAHSQNVCGLTWAPHGMYFVSGSNDNCALLFHAEDIFEAQRVASSETKTAQDINPVDLVDVAGEADAATNIRGSNLISTTATSTLDEQPNHDRSIANVHSRGISISASDIDLNRDRTPERTRLPPRRAPPTPPRSPPFRTAAHEDDLADINVIGLRSVHRHIFSHSAAVKALAFAPWQPTLLATGGGSNDRQIHFHHTESGTTLAVINVFAQVTSLSWSSTKREIVATFGYSQPEHDIRIAVFAWPSCECVVSIP